MTLFNAKFFCGEARFTLSRTWSDQTIPRRGLGCLCERFHERALDCSDAVDEETLVDMCLHGMVNEYRVYLENLTFPSFSRLMETARRTNESFRKPSRSVINTHTSVAPRPFHRKRSMIAAVEDSQGARPPRPKRPSFKQGYKNDSKAGKKSYPVLLPFPCGIKKALALLNQWIKDEAIVLPHVDQQPSEEDQ